MNDYYVEIFLGISIGAFIISLFLLISLWRRAHRQTASPVTERIQEGHYPTAPGEKNEIRI